MSPIIPYPSVLCSRTSYSSYSVVFLFCLSAFLDLKIEPLNKRNRKEQEGEDFWKKRERDIVAAAFLYIPALTGQNKPFSLVSR